MLEGPHLELGGTQRELEGLQRELRGPKTEQGGPQSELGAWEGVGLSGTEKRRRNRKTDEL